MGHAAALLTGDAALDEREGGARRMRRQLGRVVVAQLCDAIGELARIRAVDPGSACRCDLVEGGPLDEPVRERCHDGASR
jgi:hypothetical protein